MIIGSRIKEERIKQGLTQEELGNMIGVSKTTISYYERGKEQPKMEKLKKLTEVLNLTPNYIFGSEINTVLEDDINYHTNISSLDLEILNNIKTHKQLYQKLCDDPKRTVDLIELKLKECYNKYR